MASSAMLTTTATSTETSLTAASETSKASPAIPPPTTNTTTTAAVTATSAVSVASLENDDDECKDDDVLNTSLGSCANDPDFAVICAFLQKFAKELGLDLPNFKRLQEWLTNTDEVAAPIRDLHIKLLRKTRKTVHEKSWESAVSKFCFTYSAQDGWEVERFGYKQASLKVKLRILRELLESQFERNNKFRNKILTLSADSLRSQPIGRDRLGHSYWLTQDGDCNLRIYQEHLDEEIWQVVATNRDEFVNLISRLRGNEVVLPSTDIGVIDEDTSSSNSCNVHIEKPPPPVEQDDSQEEEGKVVPNLRLTLGEGGAYHSAVKDVGKGEEELAAEEDKKLEQKKIIALKLQQQAVAKARTLVEVEEEEEEEEEVEEEEDMGSEEEIGEGDEAEEEGEEEVDSADEDQSADDVEENDSEPVLNREKGKNTIPIVVPTDEAQKKVKPLLISQAKIVSSLAIQHSVPTNGSAKKRPLDEIDKTSPTTSDDNNINTIKKFRPSLLDSKRDKKPSKYGKVKSDDDEDDEDDEEGSEEDDEADIDDDEGEEEDIDSAAAEEDENEEKDIEDDDDDEDDEVGEAIEDPPIIVRGEGSGKQCDGANPEFLSEFSLLDDTFILLSQDEDDPEPEVGEAIEEEYLYISGEGNGAECLVGNKNNEESPLTPPATTTTSEPKATFFFGEPGCLKLSPIKKGATRDTDDRSNDEESLEELTTDNSANNKEQHDAKLTTTETIGLKNTKNLDKNEENNKYKNNDKLEEHNNEKSPEETQEKICEAIKEGKDVKINESINVLANNNQKGDKVETLKVNEKKDIAEKALNENENKRNQINIMENNTALSIDSNTAEVNNKITKPGINIEPEESEEKDAETLGFNGVGNKEVCEKKQENKETKSRQETETDSQNKTKEKEDVQITNKANETNSNDVKTTEKPLEKPNNTEIVEENLNIVPQKKESTDAKPVIKNAATVMAETNKSNSLDKTAEKLIKLESTDAHLSHDKTLNKTSEVVTFKDTLTSQTQIASIPQKCALPQKTTNEDVPTTTATKASLINRKRRLADFAETQKPKMRPQTTSESEVELLEELANAVANDDLEDDVAYVGGKRLKMRTKLTNTEIRKKVEAQKIAAVEETTSSSGEEEALRKRKIISPKRHLVSPKSNKIEQPKKLDKKMHATLAEIKEEVTVQAAAAPMPVKQKPTLAEIIEKKLKKTSEKPVKILYEDASTSKIASVVNATNTLSAASSKKSPITKPLKKNLLTQLRQEESDEEAIPRKRIIGETMPQNVEQRQNTSPPAPPPPPPTSQILPIDEQQKVELLARATPERQRKRRSSEEVQHPELTDHVPNTDCIGEKLKKNDEVEEVASVVKEVKIESELPQAMKRLESTREEEILKQTPPTKITPLEIPAKVEAAEPIALDKKTEMKEEETATALSGSGRRSGRRGGTAVIYAELPQPKRTRGGPKATPTAAATSKQEDTKIKMDGTETKTKEEALTETETPQVKPEVEESSTSASSKEAASQKVSDTPVDVKKSPTTPKPTKNTTKKTPKARGRKKREVDTTNIIDTADSETPVRQSRRIAQQKIREEAERRKLEEIALRSMKNELKKKKKAEAQADPSVPEPSEQSSSSDESDDTEIEEETKKLKKKKCPGKDGTWSSGSEEQEDPEEEEEPPHYETDPGSPLFRSDHEFSPESDLEDESQVVPMKRARTARKEDAELSDSIKQLNQEEEACQKCGKSDHPEWILLCDSCDKGYHCSCLSPVLFYIPEGDWYCPPCQQEQLIAALEKQLQEFDLLVKQKRLEEELAQRAAEAAERAENERLEEEKRKKKKKKQRSDDVSSDNDAGGNASASRKSGKESDGGDDNDDNVDKKSLKNKDKKAKKNQSMDKRKQRREVGGHRRRRRRAATRGARQRRRNTSKSGGSANSDDSSGSGSQSGTDSESSSDGSSSSSSATNSDDEPIYKLRKRRQINVSYRLNEYDDLINSALRKEMNQAAAYAGNLGRGKDITTIIEADKEEQARQKQLVDGELVDAADAQPTADKPATNETEIVAEEAFVVASAELTTNVNAEQKLEVPKEADSEEEPLKRKAKAKQTLKKKPRKLTTLDISSEEDNASDEDFKGSSLDEDDEDEDTSVSVSSNSDSSLEIYKRRGKKKGGKKKTRKAARRTARERRKVRKFVVDDSDDDEEEEARPKTKKKRKTDSDYTETEESGELSELSENMDSADLCDDTSSSEDSDGAWRPSKRKKQRKSTAANIARKSPKLKKPQTKKPKRVEYSDDDVSEEEEEDYEDEDDDPVTGGKGSGKQPRTVPLKPSNSGKGKGKGKGGGAGAGKSSKASTASKKKKKKLSDYDDDSLSDSEDSTRRTRGRRYAYLEDFEDDSSDGGIKPGVKRPDTPPEEREKFIKKQEEIKRMLAEKNAEGAKLAATPRLTPIKGGTRSPAKPGDSLSTVPLSVIRQAKVLDIDYLQRKGESVSDVDNVDDVDSEFDDADLPDDFPDDMDEDAIARMVEEEEGFGAAAATRELPAPDEVLKPAASKAKPRDADKPQVPPAATNTSLASPSQIPSIAGSSHPTTSASGLQEPMRKRLPMPTMHPPLLRHQYPGSGQHHHSLPPHMMQRHAGPPTHLLQHALSAPLGQPVHRNFPQQAMGAHRGPPGVGMPPRHVLQHGHSLPPPPQQQQLTASHPLPSSAGEAEQKPRGRRKKITPLRDPLQKQQAAAAATAAAAVQAATTGNASDKRGTSPPTSVATGVIKTATSLVIAQPPQLYKPSGGSSSAGQPSVITRMPHLPPHGAPPGRGMPLGPPGMYAGGDVGRFYGPPMQQPSGAPGSRMPPTSSQRHRGPPHVGSMPPHHGMRPSYGPPPPLRGVIGSSNQPPPNSVSGTRQSYPPPPPNHGEHHGPQPAGPYGTPPPARHATPHINPYRPSIFGNPNYGPRGAPPGANMRTTGTPGQEYSAGPPRSYAPYGYYPPPPPLTAAHSHPPPSTPQHAPPTSKPSASTTRTTNSNTQPPAVPSSVIVSAPASSIPLTPSAAAAQKHAPRAVIKTAPGAASLNKSTPAAVVAPLAAIVEPRKKLITLETFATNKSPLALSGESSGSRSSPNVQPDGADDSTSTPAAATTGGNGQGASEFSGLVSYFSSQHDDYNT